MKAIRNLIARLLRQAVMPTQPAMAVSESDHAAPRRMPAKTARALAFATVPWHARTAKPQDDAADALQVAMLQASCSEEGAAADFGSFDGTCMSAAYWLASAPTAATTE